MAEVQPIRGRKQIKDIGSYLKGKDEKYYIMFLIGVQSGLRASDVLSLKVSDIDSMSSKKIKEKKTSKKRFLYLNDRTEKEIRRYIISHELEPDDYLVYSRKHDQYGDRQPITRTQAYRVLREAGEAFGIEALGTHTMRKTFGYHYYKKTHDVVTLMRIFNHASQSVTLHYIGIEAEEIMQTLDDFFLF